MRTLQEKYNGIQEGKFSKGQFLVEARQQLPNLITRFNGYDDAVQILKNKGMVQEAINYDNLTQHSDRDLESLINVKKKEREKFNLSKDTPPAARSQDKELGAQISKIERELNSRKSQLKKETVKEAKLTKKSLTDYRYKPTNDMDKYPYEQILRGLRVELEGLGIKDIPTAEEYSKALAKVSKNLEKDSIFYTNQVAGVNTKTNLHDKMIPIDSKKLYKTSAPEKSKAEGNVDTFNGLKKAQVKEGFKKLIKKVLSESIDTTRDPLEDYMEATAPKLETEKDIENYRTENEIGSTDREVSKKNITLTQLITIAKRAGDIVLDAKDDLMDLGVAYGDRIPIARVKEILRDYDIEPQDLKKSIPNLEEAVDNNQDVVEFSVDSESLDKALNTYFGKNLSHNNGNYTLPREDFNKLMDYLRNQVGNQAENQVSIVSSDDIKESEDDVEKAERDADNPYGSEEEYDFHNNPEYIHEGKKSLMELIDEKSSK